MTVPTTRAAAALSAATLVLAGCGGLGGGDATEGVQGVTETVTVTASPGGGNPPAVEGDARTVPLQVVQAPGGATLALVPVFIQGEGPFLFALDTGASQSAIDTDLAQQLGLEKIGTAREVTGITGQVQPSIFAIPQWRMGDVELRADRILGVPLPEPSRGVGLRGLLGSDILSNFDTVVVDYEGQQLLLEPRSE